MLNVLTLLHQSYCPHVPLLPNSKVATVWVLTWVINDRCYKITSNFQTLQFAFFYPLIAHVYFLIGKMNFLNTLQLLQFNYSRSLWLCPREPVIFPEYIFTLFHSNYSRYFWYLVRSPGGDDFFLWIAILRPRNNTCNSFQISATL